MAKDQKFDRDVSPTASGKDQIHPELLDRGIDQSSADKEETATEPASPVMTPTDPFEGFGSFG